VIFVSGGSSWGCCVQEDTNNGAHARAFENNDLYHPAAIVMYADYLNVTYANVAALNSQGFASGNIDDVPQFIDLDGTDNLVWTMGDNNWHLDGTSSVNLRQGGQNGAALGWGFTTDREGTPRTDLLQGPNDNPTNENAGGWSMGAYERD
jgi:hypothetical protein